MKTNISMILLLLISFTLTSQTCKYEKNEIDKFTSKMTKLTNATQLFETKKSVGFVRIYRSGDTDYAINFVCDGSFNVRRVIKDGSELSFLLEDNTVITLKKSDGNSYVISKKDLIKIMETKIKSVRFQYESKNGEMVVEDAEIKKGDSIRTQNLIKCVM